MKHKKISTIWLITGACFLVAIIAWSLSGSKEKETINFTTEPVSLGNIRNSITATGTVSPVDTVAVGTQVSGIIDKIYVDFNTPVKKGQILAVLDTKNLSSQLNSAKANLQSAKANLQSAKAAMAYQQANYNRYKTLYKKGLISANDYESARLNYQQAAEQVAMMRQNVVSAQENVKTAETNLGYATITSPIDGIIINKYVAEGQTVAATYNTPELFGVAKDLKNMQVTADVDEADIGDVKEGENVTFTVDAYPDDTFAGSVKQVRIGPSTSNNVVTYHVIISANNENLKLKPGLTANVTIYTQVKANVLCVPTKALRYTPTKETVGKRKIRDISNAKNKVWTIEGNTLVAHRVSIGSSDGTNTQIISGIKQGQKVITGKSADSKKVVIELRDVKRDFLVGDETVHALRGVSFKIYEGEFVTIMGKSGSGKSTLLNQLGCLDTPTSGEYFLDGVSVRSMSKSQRAVLRNRKIGFIFQNYNLLPKTTSVENVELPLMYNSEVSAKERRERAIAALKAVGLGDRLYHMSNQMSGGQMQRVAIARALVNNPAVILADEATGNLDTRTSFEILVLFQKLHDEGRTIIFVTHNPDIAHYSSRDIQLRDGHIISDEYNHNILSAAEGLAALPANSDEW